jgi:bacillithiol system protein YtxJ
MSTSNFSTHPSTVLSQTPWVSLTRDGQLEEVKSNSFEKPVVIFKHSIRCGLSHGAKYKLEEEWSLLSGDIYFYFLDLINFRSISDRLSTDFQVPHQSPQLLVIRNGQAIYDTSHHGVSVQAINNALLENS